MEARPKTATTALPKAGGKQLVPIFFICGLFLFFIFTAIFSTKAIAATSPSIITYQGKLLTNNLLATTTQNMYFVLYDASSGGTALYTASGTVGAPLSVNITPVQGLFSVNLGDSGTNPLDPTIFQNNSSLYLEVRVGSDILTPRKRITAVPYAFNAKYVDGVGGSTLSSTTYIPISDSNGNFTFNSTTVSTSTISSLTVLGNSTLGTIIAGTWNGLIISPAYGGTGQNSTAWTGLLRVIGGVWSTSTVALGSDVSGILSIANGGTGTSTIFANGSVIYSNGTSYAGTAVGTAGQVLQSNGSGTPVWVSTSSLGIAGGGSYTDWTLATSTGDIGYSVTSGVKVIFSGINGITTTRSGSTVSLGLTNTGVVAGTYGSANALPIITIDSLGRATALTTTSIAISGTQITSGFVSTTNGGTGQDSSAWTGLVRVTGGVWSTSTVALGSDVSGILPITSGGTNTSTLGAAGSIVFSNGTSYAFTQVGTAGQVLQSNGSGAPIWVSTSSLGFGVGGSFVSLLTSTPGLQQTGNFNISGTGIIGTSLAIGTSTVTSTLTLQGVGGFNPFSIASSTGVSLFRVLQNGDITIGNSTDSGAINLVNSAGGTELYGQGENGFNIVSDDSIFFNMDFNNNSGEVIQFYNGLGSPLLTIGETPYFAFNTTTSASVLTLQGVAGNTPILTVASSTGNGLFTILANGNVGIGTSTPPQKLVVSGNISNIIDSGTVITQVGTTSVGAGVASPNSIFVSGKYAYVVNNGNANISVVDVSNPSAPVQIATTSVGGSPKSIYVSGRYAYVANSSANSISVVDISNPTAPRQIATTSVDAGPFSIYVSGRYAYTANNSVASISVIDISNPSAPVQIATTSVGTNPDSIYVSGRYAYVSNQSANTISVVDVSTPALPRQVGSVSVGLNPQAIYVSGRYAYVANGGDTEDPSTSSTISIVDISNPSAPVQISTAAVGPIPSSIYVSGRYAYVSNAGSNNNISIVDISNPSAPIAVASAAVGQAPFSIYVSGRYAYTANNSSNNISVVDISGTEVSSLIAHSAEVGNIQSRNDILAQGNIMAGTSLLVGAGGIMSQGTLSVFASSTGATSSIFNISSAASSSIFKVFANGKIGINSSSPIAMLSVNGDLAVTGGLYDTLGTLGTAGQVLQTNGTVISWVSTSSLGLGGGIIGSGTAGQFPYYAGSGTSLSPTSTLFLSTTGNIGIGTTTPIARLSVVASVGGTIVDFASSTGNSVFRILANGNVGIGSSTPTANLTIQGNDGINPLAIVSSTGASLLSVLTNGNVGIGTSTPTQKLSVVGNISNLIDASTTISLVVTTSVGSNVHAVFVSGKYAYTVNQGGATLAIIDVSNPASPSLIATTSVGSNIQSVYVSGRYAYITDTAGSLRILDVSTPATPRSISSVTLGTQPVSVYVSGAYAYVANSGSNNISVVDVSNPLAPVQIATTTVGTAPNSIYVSGRYAYVANFLGTSISIVDISNPLLPTQVSTVTVGTQPRNIYVSGRYAYTVNDSAGNMSIINIANPTSPSVSATLSVGATPYSIYVSGRYAYITNSSLDRLTVVDITSSTAPAIVNTLALPTNATPHGIYVSGRYAYITNSGLSSLSVVDISGTEVSSLIAHSAEVGNLQSRNDIFAQGNIMAGTSLLVGAGGIMSNGVLSVFASSTGATSSIFNISSAQVSNIFKVFPNGSIAIGTSTASSTLTIQGVAGSSPLLNIVSSTGSSLLTVLANGNIGINSSSPFASLSLRGTAGINPFAINSSTGAPLLHILSNGNVGIGTSTPTQKLSVIGNISNIISSGTTVSQISTTTVSGNSTQSVFVSGRYAYTVGGTSGFSVVDISNPSAPVQIATTTVGDTPFSVYVSGRYAYVTNKGAASISIVDISNPRAPVQISTTSVGTFPYSIYVSGQYAYVANYTDNSISVVDISNPSAPVQIATSSIGFSSQSIYVSGRYAYLVGGTNSFGVVDISGTEVSSLIAHSAEVGNLQSRNDIFAQGNIIAGTSLSVGVGGISSQGSLSIIGNISNITTGNTSINRVGTASVGNAPSSIFVSGRYAYVANGSPSNSLSVVDVSNPSTSSQISSVSTGGNGPSSVYVSGKYTYVTNFGSDTISVVDISNPSAPVQIATAAVGDGPASVYVSGRYAYVANSLADTISVVDISNPSAPVQIATAVVGGTPNSIFVSGRYAYTANFSSNNVSVVDISNPSAPVQIATTSVDTQPISVYVSGKYAYTANAASNTVSIINISNPSAPSRIANVPVDETPNSIFVSGRYAYVANAASNTVSVVDVSNPLLSKQVASASVGSGPVSIFVSGRYAYTANNGDTSISIVDISGTEVSSLIAHSAEVGNIQSRNDIFAQGNIMAGTGLMVGAGGIMSNGSLSVFASSTGATSSIFSIDSSASSNIFKVFANGKVGIGTSTFSATSTLDVQGQVEVNLTSPTNATFALCHTTNGAADNQVIYDCNGTAGADYMEMYAADTGLEMGDVVMFSNNFVTTADGNSIPKLTKSSAAYQPGLIGVISDETQAGDFNSIGHNVSDADNPLPLALSGRVRIKVTNANGDIHVGDKLTSSNIPGVAMKATTEGPTIAIAMGDYTSAAVGTVMGFINLSWNNNLYQALTLDVANNTLTIGNQTNPQNLVINNNISFANANIINTLSFASSTVFESAAASISGARAFTFNAVNFTGPLADNYIISLRANNTSVFSVAANGDVHAAGNYYGASAVLGTSTNPGDLAERVDIAIDDVAEPGDVMMVDPSAPDTYRRSSGAYEQSVAGVISTNPTIVVGNGRTNYTAVLAMVGRVPVKVSSENGSVARGDLLVSASTPGYAMKYDQTKDKNNKVVGIIGMALESMPPSSTGKVLALIRTGWVYNRDKDIENLKDDISAMAMIQGIDVSGSSTEPAQLNVEEHNSQLVYAGGNLNLQNNYQIGRASCRERVSSPV